MTADISDGYKCEGIYDNSCFFSSISKRVRRTTGKNNGLRDGGEVTGEKNRGGKERRGGQSGRPRGREGRCLLQAHVAP